MEWGVIKGVSGYADGSEEKTKNWRGVASVMAASVVYHMFKYPDVIKDWPHLEHTKHEKGIYSVLNINFKRLVTLSHNLFIQRRRSGLHRVDYTHIHFKVNGVSYNLIG